EHSPPSLKRMEAPLMHPPGPTSPCAVNKSVNVSVPTLVAIATGSNTTLSVPEYAARRHSRARLTSSSVATRQIRMPLAPRSHTEPSQQSSNPCCCRYASSQFSATSAHATGRLSAPGGQALTTVVSRREAASASQLVPSARHWQLLSSPSVSRQH